MAKTLSCIHVKLSSENECISTHPDRPGMALRRSGKQQTLAIRTAKDLEFVTRSGRELVTENSGLVASSRDERENLHIQSTMLCKQIHSQSRCGVLAT